MSPTLTAEPSAQPIEQFLTAGIEINDMYSQLVGQSSIIQAHGPIVLGNGRVERNTGANHASMAGPLSFASRVF